MTQKEFKSLINCIEQEGSNQILKIMDYVISSNHNGNLFGINLRTTIALNGTVTFGLRTPANSEMHVIPVIFGSDKLCFVDMYKDAIYTGGTSIVPYIWSNNHINLQTSHVTQFDTGITISTTGDNFYQDVVPAGKFSSGEVLAGKVGWLLDKDTVYTGVIDNQESQAGYLKFAMFWIEIDL